MREPRTENRDYSTEPADRDAFTTRFDRLYSRLARPYDLAVKLLPIWRRWLGRALVHIRGPRVLEVSFGTGWLLTRYAGNFETHGVDLNERMVALARRNLHRAGVSAELRQGGSRRQGQVVMIDIGYPHDGNRLGTMLVGAWKRSGDLIRDMPPLFERFGFELREEEIGGFGSVHLYSTFGTYAATRGRDDGQAVICRGEGARPAA